MNIACNLFVDDFNAFKSNVMRFDDLYNTAVKQVEALQPNNVGMQRLQYCITLVNSIYP